MCQSARPYWVKWAAAVLNCCISFRILPLGGTVGHYCKIMACNFNDNKMNFTANTLECSLSWLTNQYITKQCFVPFSLSGVLQDRIDQSQSLSSPRRCTWQGLITYSSPRDCGHIDFQQYSSILFIYFFACGWFPDTSGGQRKQPGGVSWDRVCSWQLSITCQRDESHPSANRRCGERQRGRRGGEGLISLSHLLLLSVSLSAYRALSDFLFSTHSPLRLTWITRYQADPPLQKLPSFPGILIVCHFLDLPPPSAPLLSFQCHQFMFFYLWQGKWIPCVVQIYRVHMLTYISLFAVSALC